MPRQGVGSAIAQGDRREGAGVAALGKTHKPRREGAGFARAPLRTFAIGSKVDGAADPAGRGS